MRMLKKRVKCIKCTLLTIVALVVLSRCWVYDATIGGSAMEKLFVDAVEKKELKDANSTSTVLPREYRTATKELKEREKPVILVLTYMRSGSSFTANLLAHGEGAFLYFEPLHDVSRHIKTGVNLELIDGKSIIGDFKDVAEDVMRAYLSCNIDHPFCDAYTDGFMWLGQGKGDFLKCLRDTKAENHSCSHIQPCLNILRNECTASKYIVMKTIRAPMSVMRNLMKTIPNLRVIHLVRDSRATIQSEIHNGVYIGHNLTNFVSEFCERVITDINTRKELENEFPGSFLQIRYEDLSLNPVEMTRRMYEFTGLEFTKEVRRFARNTTCTGNLCTRKNKTAETLQDWRKSIRYPLVQMIDKKCDTSYKLLGYLPAENNVILRDMKHSLLLS